MANESYMLKTQLAATGERIYYLVSAKHLLIDHKKGSADDNWFTDKFGNINSVLTPIIGVYDTYASLPSASMQTTGAYALVSAGPYLHRVEETSGTKAWTASDKGVPVDGTRLFINQADDGKLYRWGGEAFEAVSAGGASGSSGAPVIFANRIQATSPGTPGRTKSYIYQPSTDNPKIVYAVYNASTSSYVWDTEHPVDVFSIYGYEWQSALYIETDTGCMWTVSSSDSHLQPVTPGKYTKLVVMTEVFGGSGWQYAITGRTGAPAATANGRCLILTTTTSGSTTTVIPRWCLAVSDGQGGYTWDTTNTVSAADDLSTSNLYYATATGKLYMHMDGDTSLTCIASPSAGSGEGSSGSSCECSGYMTEEQVADMISSAVSSTTYAGPFAVTTSGTSIKVDGGRMCLGGAEYAVGSATLTSSNGTVYYYVYYSSGSYYSGCSVAASASALAAVIRGSQGYYTALANVQGGNVTQCHYGDIRIDGRVS